MSDSFIAATAGLCSAGLLELLRHLLARNQKAAEKAVDDVVAFRHDLLVRIDSLQEENTGLVKERDEWQRQYYEERELRLKTEWQLNTVGWIAQEPQGKEPIEHDEKQEDE